MAPFGETISSYYLRLSVDDRPGVLADVTRIIADNNISIESLIQKEAPLTGDSTEVIMMTHTAVEKDIQKAIGAIEALESVRAPVILLRKEELH